MTPSTTDCARRKTRLAALMTWRRSVEAVVQLARGKDVSDERRLLAWMRRAQRAYERGETQFQRPPYKAVLDRIKAARL